MEAEPDDTTGPSPIAVRSPTRRPSTGLRRLGHEPALDGLRAVAVLLVVGYHVNDVLKPTPFPVFNGALGVDLFFVLSGFLITALLLRERAGRGRVRFGAFYRRRALRLLPALLVLLGAFFVYATATGLPADTTRSSILSVLFYYANWQFVLHHQMTPYLGHLWSLSVEEQFYLVWPLVVVVLSAYVRRLRTVVIIMLGAIVVVALNRAWQYHSGTLYLLVYGRTDTRADALLVGALLAQLWVRRWTPTRKLAPMAWAAVAVLAACVVWSNAVGPFLYDGGFTLVALAGGVLILAAIDGDWIGGRLLGLRWLCAIGLVSYGLYLWHIPIFFGVARYGADWDPLVRVGVALALTATVTVASWFLVERPALRWKDRLEGRAGHTTDGG